MEITKYIEKVDKIYKECKEERKSEGINVQGLSNSINKEISLYESFIPEFFSNNGAATGIKNMYKDLHDKKLSKATVPFVSQNTGFHIFKEYNEGMTDFVNKIIKASNENPEAVTENAEIQAQLKRAFDSDAEFIESALGGNLNEETTVTVVEAAENIEFLIDFIPALKEFKESCTSTANAIDVSMTGKNEFSQSSLSLLIESVSDYCHKTIHTIITDYSKINDALHPVIKEEKPSFKLF